MSVYLLADDVYDFPSANLANHDGLLAIGGDLSPERLIIAYSSGIFPWYSEGEPILWWSLDPRMVMKPTEMKKGLRKRVVFAPVKLVRAKILNACVKNFATKLTTQILRVFAIVNYTTSRSENKDELQRCFFGNI